MLLYHFSCNRRVGTDNLYWIISYEFDEFCRYFVRVRTQSRRSYVYRREQLSLHNMVRFTA